MAVVRENQDLFCRGAAVHVLRECQTARRNAGPDHCAITTIG